MFPCEGVYWIRNKSLSNKFIDVRKRPYVHAGERASMPIGLFSSRLIRAQLWLVEQVRDGESFIIRNFLTSTVLDIQEGGATQHTPVLVQRNDKAGEDVSRQHWNIVWNCDDDKVPYYRITNQKTKTVITQTKNTANGADFAIESCDPDGSEQQLWAFERATFPMHYWLVNMTMNRCLDYVPNDLLYLNENTRLPSDQQLWYLEDLVDHEGYCTIRNVKSEDRVLELSGDNTTLSASTATGDAKQRWKIIDVDFNGIVTIICAQKNAVLYGRKGREGMYYLRASTDAETFGHSYQWRLIPCPTPSLFWTTLQCRDNGKFMAQSESGGVVAASNGARGEIDYTVQWRFVAKESDPRYTIISRHNNGVLCVSSESKSSAVSDNESSLGLDLGLTIHSTHSDSNFASDAANSSASRSKGCSWVVDGAGQDYCIIHVDTSKAIVCTKGEMDLVAGGEMGADGQWLINSSLQSVPSYAMINRYTGMALAYVPGVKSDSITTDTTFNSYRCLWIFQQVGTDSNDWPIYVIINKLSDHVLSHTGEKTIEALDDDPKDPHHQWRIVPCHERYFAFVNVATGECLNDDGDPPSDHEGTIPEKECRCCWTLVSYRHSVHDTIALDTDISNPDQSFFDVAKRGPKKHPKGKGNAKAEPSHIPDNPRILQVDNRVLLDIVERLINQWDIDTIPASQQAGRPVSTSRDEVLRWGLNVPRSLQVGWTRDGWIRIDIQGTYNDQNGVRVANIQGQWNNDTIFHLIVPTGVNFGRARIRQAMHDSLRTGTSVRLDAPDNTKPSGSKHKPNTTRRPPGPGAPPAGQIWAITLLSYVTLASMGAMLLL